MTDAELDALRRDVADLKDRQAIEDCIARHARGHDRHDLALMASTYHDDGIDEHGHAINAGPDYGAWANAAHAAGAENHLHHVTTHLCEIDGDVAHAESYVIVALLDHGRDTARLLSGRYLDRLERRDGEWRIALRRTTLDVPLTGDASMLKSPLLLGQGYARGTPDRDDPSYRRPLTLDAPVKRWDA